MNILHMVLDYYIWLHLCARVKTWFMVIRCVVGIRTGWAHIYIYIYIIPLKD